MILVRNIQKAVPCDTRAIGVLVEKILKILKYSDFDISITFVTQPVMREYNKKYRQKDSVTDILSFPYHPSTRAGLRLRVKNPDDKNLGDIICAPVYIKRAAIQLGISYEARLQELIIHGILHLLGYDHETDTQYRQMARHESRIARLLTENS